MIEQLNNSWREVLQCEFEKTYFKELSVFVKQEREEHSIFPQAELCFAAFNKTSFENTKVVILGQDPYHNFNQANGLSFSVGNRVKIPPSLKNIFKELKTDLNYEIPLNGNLEQWANQGVLLLNSTLSVKAHKPGSHQKKGWELFTNKVIELLSLKRENIVFILWGNYAQQNQNKIDQGKHKIITSVHPSPFSARKGFFGSKPFSKTNNYLASVGKEKINWDLSPKTYQLSI
tara:strand:- start:3591 stop:4286 length:696 start_codon:yes stop_codon:yes gene_type:complete